MKRGIPVELRSSFCSASATVVAFPLRGGGYYISRISLLRAKTKMAVPSWSMVYLLKGSPVKELIVIADNPENDEVISCVS